MILVSKALFIQVVRFKMTFCLHCTRKLIGISGFATGVSPTRTLHCLIFQGSWKTELFYKSITQFSTKTQPSRDSPEAKVTLRKSSDAGVPAVGVVSEKVKQAGKDVFWTAIVIGGVAVTGLLGFVIFRELFSSKSPSGVYSDAFKKCKKDVRVQAIMGEPIKAYGELSSLRGRRRHVQSAEFDDGGVHIVQLKFYISGPHNSAVVYAEKDVTNGVYRNLIVETDDRRERFSVK